MDTSNLIMLVFGLFGTCLAAYGYYLKYQKKDR